ncbi:hypothetical protein EDM57_04405 [Brevibacillus gelatini]|uniref:Uncharacterized protein n=1 Tax=Brevibacillus gelatini TaxID=1655277 RepID=A0A3M8B7P7_9BACL|nr:hypothetical protein [Brevibacillus gelatini]RNB59390.1 hypothetical protein EDM57_04405 [Brevibacillus gelatini]
MNINKKTENVIGTVEYEVDFGYYGDEEEFLEYEKFTNLNELLTALSNDKLEEIRNHYEAKGIKVVSISFLNRSEDKETEARMMITDKKLNGWVTTKINNDDIDNRLLTNIQRMKEIIDNTLEQYPIRY